MVFTINVFNEIQWLNYKYILRIILWFHNQSKLVPQFLF